MKTSAAIQIILTMTLVCRFSAASEKVELSLLTGKFKAVNCTVNKRATSPIDLKAYDLESTLDGAGPSITLYSRLERLDEPVKRHEFAFIDQGKRTQQTVDDWGCVTETRQAVSTKNGVRFEGVYTGYLKCAAVPTMIHREKVEFGLLDSEGLRASLKYEGSAFLPHSCEYERIP
jgi:hypothetical protein